MVRGYYDERTLRPFPDVGVNKRFPHVRNQRGPVAIIQVMEIPGYAIKRCIAEGGMAAAYLAEQTSLERTVVLKVLDTSINDSRVALRRFMNEGRLLAGLNHPNLITIYDIGTASNFIYISMEYVEGGDLKQRLLEGPLEPAQALNILRQVASGLGQAHAAGIVHRDVKPGNILFRTDGAPVLSDFGIAKSLMRDADLTATGVFLGSPNYMAPEQADSVEIDPRADIYALGIILFEMLTGEKPYQSESVIDVIQMHKKAPIPALPGPLNALQPLLALMMAKDRNKRFHDVRALLDYVGGLHSRGVIAAIDGKEAPPPPAPPSNVLRIQWAPRRAQRLRYALYALLALTLVGYGALFVVEARLARPVMPLDPGEFAQLRATDTALVASAQSTANRSTAPVEVETIKAALVWLGQHALQQQHLTTPPQDCAYYYFSRVLQLEPANTAAASGIHAIAQRYAELADATLARGDFKFARRYIALGRQLDPASEALRMLADLTPDSRPGIWARLVAWWERRG